MKTHLRILLLLAVAVLMTGTLSFAAEHDTTEDKSSDTATIYIGKVLTVNQENRFPKIKDFRFELEAVKAWDNSNTDASLSGKVIPVSEMPGATASAEEHHKVTAGSGSKSEITVGDFTGDANTDVTDTDKEKFRVTPVNIRFTKAGYYMYKVSETDSASDGVPGVQYDDSSYYVAVYVCNRTDSEGNTLPGVYVHNITSFRNSPDSDYQPDFSDIQNITDNGGTAAGSNTYEQFEKTGKSTETPGEDPETGLPTGPDKLEAYKFWNDQTTHDVVITNNVSGNLGDITKEFEFTVTLEGLAPGETYTTDTPAEYKTDKKETSEGADLVSVSKGNINAGAGTFTADDQGKAEFVIKLKDDEVFVMNALPAGATYKAEEHASDHIASYEVSSTGDKAVISKTSDANATDQKSLGTATETVDGISNVQGRKANENDDQTVTIAFNNQRNLATVTGIPYYGAFTYILALLIITAACIILTVIRKASRNE